MTHRLDSVEKSSSQLDSIPVPFISFKRWLGTSYHVWEKLCELRDSHGRCNATAGELSEATGIKLRNVKAGLIRLRKLGVLSDELLVRPGGKGRRLRIIRCALDVGSSNEVALVPPELIASVNSAYGWGGPRLTPGNLAETSPNGYGKLRDKGANPRQGGNKQSALAESKYVRYGEKADRQSARLESKYVRYEKNHEPSARQEQNERSKCVHYDEKQDEPSALLESKCVHYESKCVRYAKIGWPVTPKIYSEPGDESNIFPPLRGEYITRVRARASARPRMRARALRINNLICNYNYIKFNKFNWLTDFVFFLKIKKNADLDERAVHARHADHFNFFEDSPERLAPLEPENIARLAPHESMPSSVSLRLSEDVAAPENWFGGRGRRAAWRYRDVPPFPSLSIINPVKVPRPPQFGERWTQDRRVRFLVRTWIDAFTHLTGEDCRTFYARKSRAGVQVDPVKANYELLVHAAEKLVEYEIEPAPWVAFSFDVWNRYIGDRPKNKKPARRRKYAKKKKRGTTPPLSWVFLDSRIDERRAWFHAEYDAEFYSGHVRFTPAHRDLIYKHAAMRSALLALDNPQQDTVDKIVRKYFPDGWEGAIAKCVEETEEEQTRLNAVALKGAWLW